MGLKRTDDYQKILRKYGFKVSPSHVWKHALPGQWMSGKGHCDDTAAVETFFKTTNGFYNPRRRRSALGWKSPVAFERKVA